MIFVYLLVLVLLFSQIKYVKKQNEILETNNKNFEILVSNLDDKVSSVLNLTSSGHFSNYPVYQESADNIVLYRIYLPVAQVDQINPFFSHRMQHYTAEKELICRRFLEDILNRIEISEKDKIYILIDSGSTVFPLFKLLCDFYWSSPDKHKKTLKKIEVITNNLPGANSLLLFGKEDSSVNSDLIYTCNVLAGKIEGKYNAILSPESINHLNFIVKSKREKNDNIIFISAITGNYISLEDGILWRGAYHGVMKNAYVYNSDYVYILSPLGKIFQKDAESINKIPKRNTLSSGKDYKSLRDTDDVSDIDDFASNNILFNNDCDLIKLIPKNIQTRCRENIFLITTRRGCWDDSYYPANLNNYFTGIEMKLYEMFKDHLIISDFCPEIDSEDVMLQLHFRTSHREDVFYNYEFPHPEVKAHMKDEIKK